MKYRTHFEEDRQIDYDGSQLSTRWIERTFGIKGDAAVMFRGGCDVKPQFMVDLEDLEAGSKIYSREMLHLIIETFQEKPETAALRHRFAISLIRDLIRGANSKVKIIREGDDLYLYKNETKLKLSVSVATTGPDSSLIHIGLNIDSEGAPVPAADLSDAGLEHESFARLLLGALKEEFEGMRRAVGKVKKAND